MENTARWRISNALLFMQAVGSETRARTLLDDILDGTVRDLVNKNDLIEIIRSSDWSRDFTDSTVQHAPEDMKNRNTAVTRSARWWWRRPRKSRRSTASS